LFIGIDRYAIRACSKLGLPMVVVYGADEADAKDLRDVPADAILVFVDDQGSPEDVLSGLALHSVLIPPRAIYTNDEHAVVTASLLAQYFGCRGVHPEVAVRFRNKGLQKSVVGTVLPTARFCVIEDVRRFTGCDPSFLPAVLKPLAGAATELTQTVGDSTKLARLIGELPDKTKKRSFILEEYISGEEWEADGLLVDGELAFLSLGRYDDKCLTIVESHGTLVMRRFDDVDDKEAYQLARPAIELALRTLGLTNGIFHMELFRDERSGEMIFSECAARRGGGLIQEEVLLKTGIDLAECALRSCLGLELGIRYQQHEAVVGTTFLSAQPGTLLSYPSATEIEQLPGVAYAVLDAAIGEVAGTQFSTLIPIGAALITGTDLNDFSRRASSLQEWFAERAVVAPLNASRAELREQAVLRNPALASNRRVFSPSRSITTPSRG